MSRYIVTKTDAGRNLGVHRKVWESAHGPIPPGCIIHHIDGNGRNNNLDNLMLLTRSEHTRLHLKLKREGKDPVDSNDPDVKSSRMSCKKYQHSHRDACRASARAYAASHKKEKAAYDKARRPLIIERWKEQKARYRDNNRALINARERLRYCTIHNKPQCEIFKIQELISKLEKERAESRNVH